MVELEWVGDVLVVRPLGDLDLSTAPAFRTLVDRELDRRRPSNIVVDLSKVCFMDSSGLGAILGRFRRIQSRGRRMWLIAPQPTVRSILELSGLAKLVTVFTSGEECFRRVLGDGGEG
ncbi:MAG: STAS domain-containing protein [Bacillota bacterium]